MAQGLPQCKASSLGVWGLGSDLGFRVQGFDMCSLTFTSVAVTVSAVRDLNIKHTAITYALNSKKTQAL